MRTVCLALSVVGMLWTSGCRSLLRSKEAEIRGAIAESTTAPGTYVNVDLGKILRDQVSIADRSALRYGDWIRVELNSQRSVFLDTEFREDSGDVRDYYAVLGAELDTGDVGLGRFVSSAGMTTLQLQAGWALFWGMRPRYQGEWSVGGIETVTPFDAFAVQDVGTEERFCWIAGGPVRVSCAGSSAAQELSSATPYTTVTMSGSTCSVAAPGPIPAAVQTSFLDLAIRQAQATGEFAP